jgi:hypothetical protein
MKLTKEQILGIIRHVLTFTGGFLVVKGYFDSTLLNELIGGVIALTGTVWSVIDKNKK